MSLEKQSIEFEHLGCAVGSELRASKGNKVIVMNEVGADLKVLCFSHLRWNFVYQRPQQLLSRMAQRAEVHVWEEPIFQVCDRPDFIVSKEQKHILVITPVLPHDLGEGEAVAAERALLERYIAESGLLKFIAWYYTPMALRFSDHLSPELVIYDCMDELSAFDGAPPALIEEEKRLFSRADLVFVGGATLYESKRTQHHNVHLFPSSVDRAHFASARRALDDPRNQQDIPHPRIGFYGVLDERLDRALLRQLAALHPEWHFVLIGPVVKIQEGDLPRGNNLHYLGGKNYSELPFYLANWDVAMLPFARNASTRFISPTKTPEYLAGGKPVVSTPIRDVVKPYAEMGLVRIGETAEDFAAAIQQSLERADDKWLEKVDAFLAEISWDKTFNSMWAKIQECSREQPIRTKEQLAKEDVHV